MANKRISQGNLLIYVAILAVGLVISSGMIVFGGEQTIFLGLSLLAFVSVLTILHFNGWLEWTACGISILTYAYVQYSLPGQLMQVLFRTGIFAAALLLSFVLSRVMRKKVDYSVNQYASNNVLIEELTLHDSMGLLKWKPFQQKLDEEFLRSRRTKKPVSVMLLRVFKVKELTNAGSPERAEELMKATAAVCKKVLRTLDVVSRYDRETLSMILPETSDEEAKVAAGRLIQGVTQQVNTAVYAGIASFPNDAVSVDKITARAQAALDYAVNSEKEMVSFAQMNAGNEKEKRKKE
ncbi:MAG: diguanylate cyclase [Pelolinea sp.]|jgi:diguanylate cyclase (GGDEF)-like protein|nr:diguanylate cyclase [Pelolinea sp.]